MSAHRPWLADPRLTYLYLGAGAMSSLAAFTLSVAVAKLGHTGEPLERLLLVATITAIGVACWFAGFVASALSLARLHVVPRTRDGHSMLWILVRGAAVMSAPSSVGWFVLQSIAPETSSPPWPILLDLMSTRFLSSVGVLVPFVVIRHLVDGGRQPRR